MSRRFGLNPNSSLAVPSYARAQTLVQAFRTDTWTGYSHVPKTEDGAAFRNMLRDTYVNLKPVTATETAADSGGNTGVMVAVIVAVVAVVAMFALVLARRRPKNVEE